LVASDSACETYQDRCQGSQIQPLCYFSNGGGRYKKGDICRDNISDQSITMIFNAMSYLSMQPEVQVSLVLGFLKKSNKYFGTFIAN
jgi:hypothetical protein